MQTHVCPTSGQRSVFSSFLFSLWHNPSVERSTIDNCVYKAFWHCEWFTLTVSQQKQSIILCVHVSSRCPRFRACSTKLSSELFAVYQWGEDKPNTYLLCAVKASRVGQRVVSCVQPWRCCERTTFRDKKNWTLIGTHCKVMKTGPKISRVKKKTTSMQ